MIQDSDRFSRESGFKGQWPAVRHYYGDLVRILFVIMAVLIGIGVPLSDNLPLGLALGIPTALVLVVLAGYTNPHGKVVLMLNAIVAGAGVFLIEVFAVAAYSAGNLPLFAVLELAWLLCVAALYYSVKTVRASRMHKIGSIDGVGEFNDDNRIS